MTKTNVKISTLGKIIAIAAAILTIIMVTGKWLDLYQVPMIFGNSVQHEYTLFEISDFMDTFNMYLDNEEVSFYSTLLSGGAVIIIILSIVAVLAVLLNAQSGKIIAGLTAIISLILMFAFVGAIHQINSEVKEATYGGIGELLRTTSNPYWLIVFSILSCVGASLKSSKQAASGLLARSNISTKRCTGCGTIIETGAVFCNNCGKRTDDEPQNNTGAFCTSCGAKIIDKSEFCTSCGAKQ